MAQASDGERIPFTEIPLPNGILERGVSFWDPGDPPGTPVVAHLPAWRFGARNADKRWFVLDEQGRSVIEGDLDRDCFECGEHGDLEFGTVAGVAIGRPNLRQVALFARSHEHGEAIQFMMWIERGELVPFMSVLLNTRSIGGGAVMPAHASVRTFREYVRVNLEDGEALLK